MLGSGKHGLLLACLLLSPLAQISHVMCWALQDDASPVLHGPGKSGLKLFTYHGPVDTNTGPVLIVLHVLLKAKQRTDGSFALRTVSYAERPALEGQQACQCLSLAETACADPCKD